MMALRRGWTRVKLPVRLSVCAFPGSRIVPDMPAIALLFHAERLSNPGCGDSMIFRFACTPIIHVFAAPGIVRVGNRRRRDGTPALRPTLQSRPLVGSLRGLLLLGLLLRGLLLLGSHLGLLSRLLLGSLLGSLSQVRQTVHQRFSLCFLRCQNRLALGLALPRNLGQALGLRTAKLFRLFRRLARRPLRRFLRCAFFLFQRFQPGHFLRFFHAAFGRYARFGA